MKDPNILHSSEINVYYGHFDETKHNIIPGWRVFEYGKLHIPSNTNLKDKILCQSEIEFFKLVNRWNIMGGLTWKCYI